MIVTVECFDSSIRDDQRIDVDDTTFLLVRKDPDNSDYRKIYFCKVAGDEYQKVSPDDVLAPFYRNKYSWATRGSRVIHYNVSLDDAAEVIDYLVSSINKPQPEQVPEYPHVVFDSYLVRNADEFKHLVTWLAQSYDEPWVLDDRVSVEFPLSVNWVYDGLEEEWNLEQYPITRETLVNITKELRRLV